MAVTLVVSGALMTGCDAQRYNGGGQDWSSGDQPITNNTYVAGQGYWHAPYHSWFPYPYNYYRPGVGYYHGGIFSDAPESSPIVQSFPARGGLFGGEHAGVSRGGFGGSARGWGGS